MYQWVTLNAQIGIFLVLTGQTDLLYLSTKRLTKRTCLSAWTCLCPCHKFLRETCTKQWRHCYRNISNIASYLILSFAVEVKGYVIWSFFTLIKLLHWLSSKTVHSFLPTAFIALHCNSLSKTLTKHMINCASYSSAKTKVSLSFLKFGTGLNGSG